MNIKQNITAILETHFAGFKDELINSAVDNIMRLDPNSPDFCCGYSIEELVVFATACRLQGVDESELHDFVTNLSLAFKLGCNAYREQWEKSIGEILKESEGLNNGKEEKTDKDVN